MAPPPLRCVTTMSPPMARASCLTDDRPSPAPPKRDAMETLACENGRNRRLISASVRPIPLSETANATATLPLVLRSGVTRSATLPWSVNFTALSIRFSSAARRRTGSPTAYPGSFSEISTDELRPFAAARPVRESPALRASVRRSKKSCRTWRPGPPLRAASTNSVARLARCSAPALMVSTQRRSRSSRSEVASRLLIARMPVSGVRTSCAKAANAVSTMPGCGGGFALAARLHSGAGYALFRPLFFCWPCNAPGAHFCRHDPPIPARPAWHAAEGKVTETFSTTLSRTTEAAPTDRRAAGYRKVWRPAARNSRKAVASVDFESFCPDASINELMMPIDRLRNPKQFLQQPVHAGRPEQVATSHHLGDALQGVVDHHGQMIAGRRLLARQDDVTPGFRPRDHGPSLATGTFATLGPGANLAHAHKPPPCRAAARKACPARSAGRARPRASDFAAPG